MNTKIAGLYEENCGHQLIIKASVEKERSGKWAKKDFSIREIKKPIDPAKLKLYRLGIFWISIEGWELSYCQKRKGLKNPETL